MGAGTWQFFMEVVNNSLNSAESLTTHVQTTEMSPYLIPINSRQILSQPLYLKL